MDYRSLQFPNESHEYRSARNALLEKEVELRRVAEAVALARRALPPGGLIAEDYVFQGKGGRIRLSELFGPHKTLAIYSYMFGPERKDPCSMCTGLLDGLNGVYDHVRQRLSLVAVAESPIEKLNAWRQERNWKQLPVLSCAGTSYNWDYHGKIDKQDTTMLNVFQKEGDRIRHYWASELSQGPSDPGQDNRGLDIINPIFNLFDFTPEGRGDFYTKIRY